MPRPAGEFFLCGRWKTGGCAPKEAPPNIDAVTQALARYDRDSSGSNYIVRGSAFCAGS